MRFDPGQHAVDALRKVQSAEAVKADDALRNLTRSHLEQAEAVDALRAENEKAFDDDKKNNYQHYGATRAINYLSRCILAAEERVNAAQAEKQSMLNRSAREGRRINAESMGEVERAIARAEAVRKALGECVALLNAKAARLRQNGQE